MKSTGEGRTVTWKEIDDFSDSITSHPTEEQFAEMARLYSLLDLASIPDDVGFQDEEFQAKVDAARAEKARREGR